MLDFLSAVFVYALSLLSAPQVQVNIKLEHRFQNPDRKSCVWRSLQTLAYHNKISNAQALEKFFGGSCTKEAEVVLQRLGIPYKVTRSGSINLLKKYVAKLRYGAAVSDDHHMMVMVHFDVSAGVVGLIDNRLRTNRTIQFWSVQRFLTWWDGCAMVVLPYPEVMPW